MTDEIMLVMLKNDLELLTNAKDDFLKQKLEEAKAEIKSRGITLPEVLDDYLGGIVVAYAAFLYRSRAASDQHEMPRFLKDWLNRLYLQSGGGASV